MSTRRNRYVALDQRTGRLERAINLVNDGQEPNLKVMRSEADKYNPQTRGVRIPLDRVAVMGQAWISEPERGPTNVLIGYDAGASAGSNWERPGVPALHYGRSGGFETISEGYGFGLYGFGQYGFGGVIPETEHSF